MIDFLPSLTIQCNNHQVFFLILPDVSMFLYHIIVLAQQQHEKCQPLFWCPVLIPYFIQIIAGGPSHAFSCVKIFCISRNIRTQIFIVVNTLKDGVAQSFYFKRIVCLRKANISGFSFVQIETISVRSGFQRTTLLPRLNALCVYQSRILSGENAESNFCTLNAHVRLSYRSNFDSMANIFRDILFYVVIIIMIMKDYIQIIYRLYTDYIQIIYIIYRLYTDYIHYIKIIYSHAEDEFDTFKRTLRINAHVRLSEVCV